MRDTAKSRLHGIATVLGLPVEVFLLPRPDAAAPRVFASREKEAAEVLRAYFAINDPAVRTRCRELLDGLANPVA